MSAFIKAEASRGDAKDMTARFCRCLMTPELDSHTALHHFCLSTFGRSLISQLDGHVVAHAEIA